MNIAGLVGALLPVFFVLALGYAAGKRNAFDADQAAGLSKLALTFALPASLFVSMTDIRKDLLLQQGRLVLALILSHTGLFVAAWLALGLVKSLRGTTAIIYALVLSTSATPVFGLAVLGPILGPTSAGTVGLVALAINLVVPPAVVLLEMDAATKHQQVAIAPSKTNPILTGLNAGLQSPLLWAPLLGIAVVLAGIRFAGCCSKLLRADRLRHFGGSGFCGGSHLGGSYRSPFACRLGGITCTNHSPIRFSLRPTASVGCH